MAASIARVKGFSIPIIPNLGFTCCISRFCLIRTKLPFQLNIVIYCIELPSLSLSSLFRNIVYATDCAAFSRPKRFTEYINRYINKRCRNESSQTTPFSCNIIGCAVDAGREVRITQAWTCKHNSHLHPWPMPWKVPVLIMIFCCLSTPSKWVKFPDPIKPSAG